MNDKVDHPKNYNFGNKFEVIDVIEDWKLDFCTGNAVKYIARSKRKGNEVEDLKKAIWYLNRKLEDSQVKLSWRKSEKVEKKQASNVYIDKLGNEARLINTWLNLE